MQHLPPHLVSARLRGRAGDLHAPLRLFGNVVHSHRERDLAALPNDPMHAIALDLISQAIEAQAALTGQHAPLQSVVVRDASIDAL